MEKLNTCCAALSLTVIISGILLGTTSNELYHALLERLLDLTPGNFLFREWMKPAPTLCLDIYFFNWTNPDEFEDKSKKPTFTEIGPFRFDVQVEKTNVTFNEQNDTITYGLKRWYKFNRQGSVQGLNYTVTILNQLSAAAAYRGKDINFFYKKTLSISLSSLSSVKMTKTVGELLFDGAQYAILDFFRTMSPSETIPDKFGFFYEKNGSSDGIFNIGTGRGGHKLGMLYEWNGQNQSGFYGEKCRNIGGAAMDFYTNSVNDKMVEIFNPEICRKLPLEYVGKSEIYGIEGLKFEMGDLFLDNGTLIPGNECFCADQCIRSGAIPATSCKQKANNYLSLPHFLKADPYYTTKVHGMRPDPENHSFDATVEPVTGILLNMNARLQLNIYVEPTPQINMYAKAPSVLFPVMWFHHKMEIPKDAAIGIRIFLNLKGIFIFLGVLLCVIGILSYIIFALGYRKKRKVISNSKRYKLSKEMMPLN